MEAKDLHSSDGSKRCVDLLPMTAVGLLLMPLTLCPVSYQNHDMNLRDKHQRNSLVFWGEFLRALLHRFTFKKVGGNDYDYQNTNLVLKLPILSLKSLQKQSFSFQNSGLFLYQLFFLKHISNILEVEYRKTPSPSNKKLLQPDQARPTLSTEAGAARPWEATW